MRNTLEISLAQSPAELDGPEARLNWLEATLAALDPKTELLALPELFACGYNIGDSLNTWAETNDGPTATAISSLAQKHRVAIHYSYAERGNNCIYNSSQCFDETGNRIGEHRKLSLPPGFEVDQFAPGKGCRVFGYRGFKIATLICYDVEFPENARHLGEQSVDLIIVPTALGKPWGVVAEHVVPTRAFENGCYVAYANQAGIEHGLEYYGGSCISSPQGQVLARAGSGPEIIYASLDTGQVTAARQRLPYLTDRHKIQR